MLVLVLLLTLAGWPTISTAQDFSIYTRVFDVGASNESDAAASGVVAPIVSRSYSMFHAGKVYDYIENVDEVVVIDFAQRQFTLLSPRRQIGTTVHFEEVKNMIKVAERLTRNHLEKLEQDESPSTKAAATLVRFQLDPHFHESYDEPKQTLAFASEFLRYDVACAAEASPEHVTAYLRYADWMSRLNYVLHPGPLQPPARLAVNAGLRKQNLIPLDVELQANTHPRIHLRAEHRFEWQLDHQHRSLIDQWESTLKSNNTRYVKLREYQQQVLLADKNGRK
jgi:hypothetical protein